MKRIGLITFLLLALAIPAGADDFNQTHTTWNNLLQKHVTWINNGTASQVDYNGFQSNSKQLQQYLTDLSGVPKNRFDSWDRNQQLAFLINAYNAFTVKLILDNYPGISSIRDTGSLFTSPWKKDFFQLFGDKRHLDWIEHEMIRGSGRYNEPLIHFAVNCASVGCPALLNEAFVAERLDEQLLDVTRRFLQDHSRNNFDVKSNSLKVSSIFDWYEEDFTKGWRGYSSLRDFFGKHADWFSKEEKVRKEIRKGDYAINFLDYDWQLNRN